jgi:gliding motility-associated-like protein
VNTGSTDTIHTVMLVALSPFGCADTTTVQITVAPGVSAGFIHNGIPGCAPMDVTFTNTSTGAGSYVWDFGDGNTSTVASPSHTYVNNTFFLNIRTVTLTALSPAGCVATATQQIMVYPTPDFTFVATPDSGCSPLSVTFPSVVGAVSYAWDFGDGSTGAGPSPTHTYLNSTTNSMVFPITLVGSNAFGCTDTTSASVVVHPNPTAEFELSSPTGCHPFTAQLTNLSMGGDSYVWSYGDGQTSTDPSGMHPHTWNNFAGPGAVSYPVSLTTTTVNGCTSTYNAQVQVFPAVTAAFVVPDTGCAPLAVPFINLSNGAVSYQWNFGDGQASLLSEPTHVYFNQGLADVTYTPVLIATSSFGCADTVAVPVVVHPQPVAQFIAGATVGCQPLVVPFQDLSIGATSLLWQFGDGQVLAAGTGNTTHTYTHTDSVPVVFDARLIATSVHGCTDTTQHPIQVYPAVVADFTVDTVGCSPLTVTLVNTGTGGTTYLWDMGDGNMLVGAAPSYTYVNTTTAVQLRTITLTSTSPYGCVSVMSRTVQVHPTPTAGFQATPFTQVFPDATVVLNNTSAPGNWNYQWSFGDGASSTDQDPADHVYGTWGTFTITLVVSGVYCTDTATQDVVIVPPLPTAGFLGQGIGCAPLTVSFTNTSWQAFTYQWHFGDGGTSTADNPTYVYNQPGTYSVTLVATGINGNSSTLIKVDSVVVHPRATAYFVLQPEEVIVPSEPVFTYNLSGNATTYHWDFGDGTVSDQFNPVHYYTEAGDYDVLLIANNQWDCPDTFRVESAVTGKVSGDLTFPNAFTPGNSGPTGGVYDPRSFDNDIFFPLYEGVESYKLEVFNRWGELLFVSEDVQVGWDGYYRGQPAKQDVYVWKAYATFSDGREAVLKGDVTLLR